MKKMLRVILTRGELFAAHFAMAITCIQHKLEDDPEAKPMHSALMKFTSALENWDGERTAKLVLVAGETIMNNEPTKIDVLTFPAQVKVKGEFLVQWNCFCKPSSDACPFCRGSSHIERWMPARLLTYFKDTSYMVLGRRKVEAGQAC
jgi:hypothetical protein